MENKFTKIVIGVAVMVIIASCIVIYNAGKRVGDYPCTITYEELTLSEKIASKLEGYNIKTKDEMKKEEQKAIDDARKDKEEKAKKEGNEIAKKIEDRIAKGEFTMEQYTKLDNQLIEKLKNNKITINELNEIHENLANGKSKIEDYLK